MGLTINTNIASQIAQMNLSKNTKNVLKVNERLSTGLRLNHASDDAAGLSISERLTSQIQGLHRAASNAQDGISLLQITEGALSTMVENLQRIREITVQAASDTYSSTERQSVKGEVEARVADIQMTKDATQFNKITLLDGTISSYILRVGANADNATNTLDISGALINTLAQFLSTDTTSGALSNAFGDGDGARAFLGKIDDALKNILNQRSTLGALQSRLESTIVNLQVSEENYSAANSRIKDIDIANATADSTKYQILQQASVSILSQTNQLPSIAITLLQNSMG